MASKRKDIDIPETELQIIARHSVTNPIQDEDRKVLGNQELDALLALLYPKYLWLIIEEYISFPIQYSFSKSWTLPTESRPVGIISDQKLLYICTSKNSCLRVYDLEGKFFERESPLFNRPYDIDLYQNCLYIIDYKNVSIFNLQIQLLSSFPLPYTDFYNNHLKVDQNLIFITLEAHHEVYVHVREGKLQHTIGSTSSSSKQGEFSFPRGLTVNNNTLYICEQWNNRIQHFFFLYPMG